MYFTGTGTCQDQCTLHPERDARRLKRLLREKRIGELTVHLEAYREYHSVKEKLSKKSSDRILFVHIPKPVSYNDALVTQAVHNLHYQRAKDRQSYSISDKILVGMVDRSHTVCNITFSLCCRFVFITYPLFLRNVKQNVMSFC